MGKLKVSNIVKTPFDNIGIIRSIKDIPWGFKYEVELLKDTPIHSSGDIEEFKEEQLEKINL